MIYKKPSIKYTEMAMYIDKYAYDENCTDEINNTIFEYLFHLVSMLAYKSRYFQKYSLYEDFSIYVASDVYMRLKNPKQFKYKENGEPELRRIKSILNYLKTILYPKKVDFEQLNYDQTFSDVNLNIDVGIGYTFADSLIDQIDAKEYINFNLCLGDITNTIHSYIFNLPFKNNQKFTYNLYLSCLLTFLSSITPKNSDLERIKNFKLKQHREKYVFEIIDNTFTQNDVILYHLDKKYQKYVFVLTNRVKHLIANDLSMMTDSEIQSASYQKSILINDIISQNINNEDKELYR